MTFAELQRQGIRLTEAEYMSGQREVVRALKGALQAVRDDLRRLYDKLSSVPPESYFNEAVKFRRLAATEERIIAHYRAAARTVKATVEHSAQIAISNSYYRAQYVNVIGSSLIDAHMTVPILPREVIETSVYGTRQLWANRFGHADDYVPKSGTLLRALMDSHRASDVEKLRRSLIQSLSIGESYADSARRVKAIMDTSASDAMRIVRTEGHRNAMAGQYAAKESAEADGVPVRRQILATLDGKTRDQSQEVDGEIEDDEGYFQYPGQRVKVPGNSGVAEWDINDREAVIMTIDGVEPTVRRARDPVTGESDIISWQRFDEWAESEGLTTDRNGQILGG